MARYGIVLVTTGSEAEARALAGAVVRERLAACATVLPVRSVYLWQGDVCDDPEWQLLLKTDLERFADLSARIRELHSYELPEIIAIALAAGLPEYLQWIGTTVGTES